LSIKSTGALSGRKFPNHSRRPRDEDFFKNSAEDPVQLYSYWPLLLWTV
jgi:hypothetical protein